MQFSMLEKLGAGALLSAWVIYGSNFLGDVLVHVADDGTTMASAEHGAEPAAATTAAAPKPEVDFAVLLASADAGAGEKVFAKCKACHSVDPAAGNKVGPNLHNVVGRDKGHHEGFAYSDTIAQMGGTWTYEDLNHFIESPKTFAPGTKMTFGGLSKASDRANVIMYLRANTENPPPLPEPKPQAAAAMAETTDAAAANTEQAEMAAAVEHGTGPAADAPAETAQAETETIEDMIAAASVEHGAKVFNKCKACHTDDEGGKNKVGPNLWNIVGHPKASIEGFSYSSALQGLQGTWTYEDLDAWLHSPKTFAPGTKMTFAGLSKASDRAAVIAYLRSQSSNPPPLK